MRLIQSGPDNAQIVAVGESPGKNEDIKGIPFVGGAGEILDRGFDVAKIHRHEVFITNVAHIRPPGDDFFWFYKPTPKIELLQGILQLKTDIDRIKPNLIIALGGQPLRILTGKSGITKWRGSILASTLCPGRKVIATFHPASVLRIFDNHGIFQTDLRRCAEECKFPEIILPQREFTITPPWDVRDALVREMASAEWLSIDIECFERSDGTWELSCVGFSDRADRALVIGARDDGATAHISQLCGSGAAKIFQNGQFDITVLKDNGIEVKNTRWDTMYAHHALFAECAGAEDEVKKLKGQAGKTVAKSALGKGLAFQTSIYTKEPFYKDDGKLWKATNDLQLFYSYNAKDAAVTKEIQSVQMGELDAFGVRPVFEHEMALQPLLMHMTRTGFAVDQAVMTTMRTLYEQEIGHLQDFLDIGAGKPINVKSPDVKWLLFEKLGLPVKKRSEKTDAPVADKYAIADLAAKHPHPLLLTILEIRSRRDMIERYLNVALDADGRWRALFDPTGTRTGRLASRSNIYGTGNNLQNIPDFIRRIFVADSGKILFNIDLSQAEARVVAYLARCEGLINLFESGKDIHAENAILFFNLTCRPDQVEEQFPGLRFGAKRVVHGSNYGMQAPRLVESANDDARRHGQPHRLDLQIANKGQQMYFMLYPEIRDIFWHEVRTELRQTRILNTPFGRKRMFFGRWDEKFLNEAYAYIPQSTIGDQACAAMINLWDNDKKVWKMPDGAGLLVNGHDSLVGQCWEKDLADVVSIVRSAMRIPLQIHGRELIVPTDVKVGRNWASATENNPEGMKKWKVA